MEILLSAIRLLASTDAVCKDSQVVLLYSLQATFGPGGKSVSALLEVVDRGLAGERSMKSSVYVVELEQSDRSTCSSR